MVIFAESCVGRRWCRRWLAEGGFDLEDALQESFDRSLAAERRGPLTKPRLEHFALQGSEALKRQSGEAATSPLRESRLPAGKGEGGREAEGTGEEREAEAVANMGQRPRGRATALI